MMKSRCGLLCSECTYREPMGCPGCLEMEKPFWGESCPVKTCCESRQHEHCGQCGDIPCAMLHQFAHDEQQGDQGKRIERCKSWCEN